MNIYFFQCCQNLLFLAVRILFKLVCGYCFLVFNYSSANRLCGYLIEVFPNWYVRISFLFFKFKRKSVICLHFLIFVQIGLCPILFLWCKTVPCLQFRHQPKRKLHLIFLRYSYLIPCLHI